MEKKVRYVEGDIHLRKLHLYFKKNKTDYAVVKGTSSFLGIVTIKDLFGAVRKELDEERITVNNIMSPNIVTLNPGSTLNEALTIMINRKFNQIPLFTDGVIEGIISFKTLLEGYTQLIAQIKKDQKLTHFRAYLT